MKYNEKTGEIEGTPQEIAEYRDMLNNKKQKKEIIIIPKNNKNIVIGPQKWTDEELKILKDNINLKPREIAKLFPYRTPVSVERKRIKMKDVAVKKFGYRSKNNRGKWSKLERDIIKENINKPRKKIQRLLKKIGKIRTIQSIYNEIYMLGLSNKHAEKQDDTKKSNTKHLYFKSAERGRFITTRADYYQKQFNWQRNKAFVQACADWKNNKSVIGKINNPEGKYSIFQAFADSKLLKEFTNRSDAENYIYCLKIDAVSANDVDTKFYLTEVKVDVKRFNEIKYAEIEVKKNDNANN